MIKDEQSGEAQLSVAWQGESDQPGDQSLERAAVYSSVLARTLSSAGYRAKHLSIGLRREGPGVLHLEIQGDIPNLSEADFSSIARATLNGVSSRLGFSVERDLILHVALAHSTVHEAAPTPVRRGRDWALISRIAIGLSLGVLLGFLGLPRLDIQSLVTPRTNPQVVIPAPAPVVTHEDPTPLPLPTPTPAAVRPTATPSGPRVLFGDAFAAPPQKWPNDPLGTAWFANGEYRLFARDPGRFVAVGVPLQQSVEDVKITGQFHKVNGPAGGGYGFIVRDQGATADRDGRNQAGQYLVVEVGDRGDVGVWQREQTRWIDVLPWTHADAVNLDRRSNALMVTTHGPNLRVEVNGTLVADLNYARVPPGGGVGLFTGGDLNEVALERLRIETP
jgi:hypothetical protein